MPDSDHKLPPGIRARIESKYSLEKVIGEGATATVYRARHRELDRLVAIKVLKPVSQFNDKETERFEFEGRAMARLDNRNLVKIYENEFADGMCYLVVEYVPGGSLSTLISRVNRLPARIALQITSHVLKGLGELHRHGYVHRDLKPANILIHPDGVAKVTDFGLMQGPNREFTTTAGVIVGTPAYMSPERIRGKAVGPESDLYSLGIVLFEMLTGRIPHASRSEGRILQKRLTNSAMRLREIAPDAPSWLDRLVAGLLEADPIDRYASASATLKDLEAGGLSKGHKDTVELDRIEDERLVTREIEDLSGKSNSARLRDLSNRGRQATLRTPARTSETAEDIPAKITGGEPRRDDSSGRGRTTLRNQIPRRQRHILGTLVTALLLASGAAAGLVYLLSGDRPDFDIKNLGITATATDIQVSGLFVGTSPFSLCARTNPDDLWTTSISVLPPADLQMTVLRPDESELNARTIEIRGYHGDTPVFQCKLPQVRSTGSPISLESVRIIDPDPDFPSWWIRFKDELSGSERKIEAIASIEGDEPRVLGVSWSVPAIWNRVEILEIGSSGQLQRLDDPDKNVDCDIKLKLDQTFITEPRVRSETRELIERIESRRKRTGEPYSVPDIYSILGYTTKTQSKFTIQANLQSLARDIADEALPLSMRRRVFEYVQELNTVILWARYRGIELPIDLEPVLDRFIVRRRLPWKDYEFSGMQRFRCFSSFGSENQTIDLLAGSLLKEAFGPNSFLKPERPDRPVSLLRIRDVKDWATQYRIEVTVPDPVPSGPKVGLRFLPYHLYEMNYLRVTVPGPAGPLTLHITNPGSQFTWRTPQGGSLPFPEEHYSWLNLPVACMKFEFEIPQELLPTPLPGLLKVECHALPGVDRLDEKAILLMDATWFDLSPG